MTDKGLPQVDSMNRISSANTLPLGRSLHSGFKRFPEDKTNGAKTTFQAFGKVETQRAFSAFPQKPKKKSKKE